jgi:hypothetical protein
MAVRSVVIEDGVAIFRVVRKYKSQQQTEDNSEVTVNTEIFVWGPVLQV